MARKSPKHAEEDEIGKVAAVIQNSAGQTKRKGVGISGTRAWLVVSESGESHLEDVGKHSIMRRTGLPARDLRVMDPVLSYPSTILGRERAIVVILEHIRAIITAKDVLMLNSTNPLVVSFVADLQKRVSTNHLNTDGEMVNTVEAALESVSGNTNKDDQNTSTQTSVATGSKLLPFEFRALEVCLESARECLESQTGKLEEEAYPALDELTSKISTLNLERVRQLKSRLVEISGRVQKVRNELEHLLDDDNDMAEMYLTEKLDGQLSHQTSSSEELCNESAVEVDDDEMDEECVSEHSTQFSMDLKTNIEELEMLLEAYFVQIDGVAQKLANMNEYVENTEDYINIMLDDKQNQLLQMGVMLSTSTLMINAGIVVVGLFGMNVHIELFEGRHFQFWATAVGTAVGCITLFLIAVGWGKKRSLI